MRKWICLIVCCFLLIGCQSSTREPLAIIPVDKENIKVEVQEETVVKEESPVETETPSENNPETTEPTAPSSLPSEDTTAKQEENTPSQPTIEETKPIQEEDPIAYATVSIDYLTILDNMDKLKKGYENYIEDGYILKSIQVEIEEGDTVLSLLQRVCQANEITIKQQSGYIVGIENIDVGICGNLSGWIYSVNHKYVNVGASQKAVQDGDVIEWRFTCDNGRDLNLQ